MATQRHSQQLCRQVFHRSPLGAVRREDDVIAEVKTEAYTVELRATGEQRVSDDERLAYRTKRNRDVTPTLPGLKIH